MIKIIIKIYKILISRFFYKEKPVVGCIYRREFPSSNRPDGYIDAVVLNVSKRFVEYQCTSINGLKSYLICDESVKYFMSIYSKITDIESVELSKEIDSLVGVNHD